MAILFQGGDAFSDSDALPFFATGIGVVPIGSAVIDDPAPNSFGVGGRRQFPEGHPRGRALEKLDADASRIRHVSRATGPLWLEFPAHVLGSSSSRTTRRLARELLLDERIDLLRELAGQPSRPVTR